MICLRAVTDLSIILVGCSGAFLHNKDQRSLYIAYGLNSTRTAITTLV